MLASNFFKFVFTVSLAWTSLVQAGDFDLAALMKLVETKKYKTMDALITDLPEDMRSSFTLVYHSNSLQEGSPMQPRAIVFSPDGKLIITFNGDSKQKGGNDIEVMAFDDEKSEFELREIHFDPEEKSPAKLSEKNPEKCISCHGATPRPIWDHYPAWRGVYGSSDDILGNRRSDDLINNENVLPRDQEAKTFLEMKTKAIHSDRYKSLIWSPLEKIKSGFGNVSRYTKEDYYPYYAKNDYPDFDENMKFSHTPNTRLGMLLFSQNSHRVVKRLKQHTDYNVMALRILYLSNECDQKERLSEKESWASRFFNSKFGSSPLEKTNDQYAKIEKILNYLGAELEHDLDVKFKKYQGESPEHYSGTDGFNNLNQLLSRAIYNDLMKSESNRIFFNPYGTSQEDFDQATKRDFAAESMVKRYKFLQGPYDVKSASCEEIFTKMEDIIKSQMKSSAELCIEPGIEMEQFKPIIEVQEKILVQNKKNSQKIFKTCIECHETNYGAGPFIPYAHPDKLQARSDKDRLKKEILRRIALPLGNKQHMPIGSELSEAEKKEMREFVEAL